MTGDAAPLLSQTLHTVVGMTIRRKNPRLQGLIGLGAAIDWFTRNGYFVAIPLNDSQPWDLIVEDAAGVVSRVQVKTTTCRNRRGRLVVMLATIGGNQSFSTRKPFDAARSELLFVLTDDADIYVIPCPEIDAVSSITLDRSTSGSGSRGSGSWWWEKDSNLRRHSRGVYSAIPLATRASHREATW